MLLYLIWFVCKSREGNVYIVMEMCAHIYMGSALKWLRDLVRSDQELLNPKDVNNWGVMHFRSHSCAVKLSSCTYGCRNREWPMDRNDKGGRGWLHRECLCQKVSFARFCPFQWIGSRESLQETIVFMRSIPKLPGVAPAIDVSTNSGNIPITSRYHIPWTCHEYPWI